MIFILYFIGLPSSVHMKVGEDVVLETSRDELGQKSTEAGEGSKIIFSYI